MKFFLAFLLSLAVSFLLFFLMDYMITINAKEITQNDKISHEIVLNVENEEIKEEKKEEEIKEILVEKFEQTEKIDDLKLEVPEIKISSISIEPIKMEKLEYKKTSNASKGVNVDRLKISAPVYESIDATLALKRVEPKYPRRAKKRGIQGSVNVRFKISPNGEVFDMQITFSKPKGVFEKTALDALKRWKFSTFSESKKYKISSVIFNFRIDR